MKIAIYVVLFIIFFGYMFSIFIPNLKILQLEEYSILKLIKYNFKYKKYLISYYVLVIIFFILFIFDIVDNYIILLIFNCLTCLINFYILIKLKTYNIYPKFTNRIIRFILLFLIMSISILILSICMDIMLYIVIYMTIIYDILTIMCGFVISIFEYLKMKKILKLTSKKLQDNKLIKIAIVGSYAKTSVKNILATILSEKYSVLSTPKSYNTPSGLSLTINNNNLKNYEIILLEMGAKKVGEINYLCKYFKPDYAILTAIGKQHLDTFKSVDNIIKTKTEILDYVNSDCVVLNIDNEYINNIESKNKFLTVGLNNDANLTAIIKYMDSEESNFDIYCNGKFLLTANTFLTGKHNIVNILLAVGMAIKLNVSSSQIKKGISKLKPIESRMQKIELSNGVIVINNGYNSNPSSAEASLNYIKLFKNRYRIVITPGFVEMGKEQQKLNYEFGQKIAEVADKCVVVNKTNKQSIIDGLKSKDFNNYEVVDKFKNIDFSRFDSNSVILIENDLPDNYV